MEPKFPSPIFQPVCLLPFFTSSCQDLPLFIFIYLSNRAIYKNDYHFSFLLLFPKHIIILSSSCSFLFIFPSSSSSYLIFDTENFLHKQRLIKDHINFVDPMGINHLLNIIFIYTVLFISTYSSRLQHII